MTEGSGQRGNKVRLRRDNVSIHECMLSILERCKDDLKEQSFEDMRAGDVIKCFKMDKLSGCWSEVCVIEWRLRAGLALPFATLFNR